MATRAAIVFAALAVLYLVGANVFLRTRLGHDAMNKHPSHLRVEYANAYSIFPGLVHAEGVTIRGRDSQVEWIFHIDQCDLRVSIVDLARKRFHATHVTGTGFAIRIRLRLDAEDAAPGHVAMLPPIDGFADPPLKDFGPPLLPLTDAEYNLWTVQLDDVEIAHMREIWFHTMRGVGDMHLRGRWLFRPLRWLEVGPSVVDVDGVDVFFGANPLVENLHGTITTTTYPTDLKLSKGLDFLRQTSADMQLTGALPLGEAMATLTHMKGIEHVRGGGPLDVRVLVDRGVLQRGTRIESESPDTAADAAGLSLHAAMRTKLSVEDDVDGKRGVRAVANATDVRASADGIEYARVASFSGALTSNDLDITRLFWDARVRLDVDGAESHALGAWVAKLAPKTGIVVESGDATAAGHVEGPLAEGRFFGRATFGVARLATKRDGDRVMATLDGDVNIPEMSFADRKLDFSGSRLVAKDVVATVRDVDVRSGAMELRTDRAILTRGAHPDVDMSIDVPAADVDAARAINHALSPGSALHVTAVRARVSAHAKLSLSKRTADGVAAIDAPRLAGRIRSLNVGTKLASHIIAKWDWASHALDLSGSDLRLRDVSGSTVQSGLTLGVAAIPSFTLRARRLTVDAKGVRGFVSADLPRADLSDLYALGEVLPMPKGIAIEGGRGEAHGHVDLDLSSYATSGTFVIASRAVVVRAGPEVLTGDVTADVRIASGSQPGSILLSGSALALTDIAIRNRPTFGWWARFALRDAQIETHGGLRFDGTIHASARDAAPISEPLVAIAGLPRWVSGFVRMKDLETTADLRVSSSSFEVSSFVARGEGVTVRMEYAKRDEHAEGAVLIDTGLLDVGVHIHDGGSHVILVGAKSWFSHERIASTSTGAK